MYQRMIEDYLTYYQPELKAGLISQQSLQSYLENQAAAMLEVREQILEQLKSRSLQMSQLQMEMEADQTVREMFMPLR